ncbi:hypothetical protein KUCAC02_033516 [Chaenocephalus aceratus]|nr:hypothetical protein KUCAC02_033516 [Chaenocephalus aceratus]
MNGGAVRNASHCIAHAALHEIAAVQRFCFISVLALRRKGNHIEASLRSGGKSGSATHSDTLLSIRLQFPPYIRRDFLKSTVSSVGGTIDQKTGVEARCRLSSDSADGGSSSLNV